MRFLFLDREITPVFCGIQAFLSRGASTIRDFVLTSERNFAQSSTVSNFGPMGFLCTPQIRFVLTIVTLQYLPRFWIMNFGGNSVSHRFEMICIIMLHLIQSLMGVVYPTFKIT